MKISDIRSRALLPSLILVLALTTGHSITAQPAPTYPWAHRDAPKHPAPRHPAPRHPAPRHPAPRHPAPKHPAPKHPAPRHPAPRHPAPKHPAPRHPNIILIVADDLGYRDLGAYGNALIETPHLDRLAAEGLRLTRGYAAAPLCSPTRASIQTGLNPARINLTVHIHGHPPTPDAQRFVTPRTAQALDTNLTTIPEVLGPAGYATAHIGKWHLGGGRAAPQYQGYDLGYGGSWSGLPNTFFYPFFDGDPYPELRADTEAGDYLTDALTDRALGFVRDERTGPFYLQLDYYNPHVPIEAPADLIAYYRRKAESLGIALPNAEYAAMVARLDANVGRVVALVDSLGLRQNTLIVFTSDNGGLHVESIPGFDKHTPPTTNAPLREGKGTLWDGGQREPWILSWPGVVEAGRTSDELVVTTDLLNTFAELAGATYRSLDGTSLVPLLRGEALPERRLFIHFPHYTHQGGLPGTAVYDLPHKLIWWEEAGCYELYDVVADPGETRDLAAEEPGVVAELAEAMRAWRRELNVMRVVPNPRWVGR